MKESFFCDILCKERKIWEENMTKNTNEDIISENLKYIGLSLTKIPTFLSKTIAFEYQPRKEIEDNYKVYQYIPISKIKILLTQSNRLNTKQEIYSNASSLSN